MRVLPGLAALLIMSAAHAGEIMTVTLSDGSTIKAEVVSLQGDSYTLRSPSMGTLTVPATRVLSLSRGNNPPPSPSPATTLSQADLDAARVHVTQAIMSNPKLMERLLALQHDPAIRRIMNDPKLSAAVQAGDVGQLQAMPEFGRLLNHPAMLDLIKSSQP
ncbi:MAG: hypothetical protein HQL58_06295 [Magnetococcales bacterium]|nr:hypothetical protein [Magnetococcales bacterium]